VEIPSQVSGTCPKNSLTNEQAGREVEGERRGETVSQIVSASISPQLAGRISQDGDGGEQTCEVKCNGRVSPVAHQCDEPSQHKRKEANGQACDVVIPVNIALEKARAALSLLQGYEWGTAKEEGGWEDAAIAVSTSGQPVSTYTASHHNQSKAPNGTDVSGASGHASYTPSQVLTSVTFILRVSHQQWAMEPD
jgi:hypothetical protein